MQTFDRFEIRFNLFSFPCEEELIVAEIYINDRSLLDMVGEVVRSEIEKRRAAGEDIGDYSGNYYSYLPANWVLLPSRRLLDKPDDDDLDSGRSMVLICTCGDSGCGCLGVQIALTNSTVEWSNFSNNFSEKYNLGTFRFDRDQYIAELSKEIALATFDSALDLNRGDTEYNLGDYRIAIAAYDRAIELNPNNADLYLNRGNAKYSLGECQMAMADYDNAIELNPNNADTYFYRGNAKYNLGECQMAIADYDSAIELNPNDADTYFYRGYTKYSLGDEQDAIVDYDKAIELNPNDADTYFYRGQAKSKLGNKQEGIADLTTASELFYQQSAMYSYEQTIDLIRKLQ